MMNVILDLGQVIIDTIMEANQIGLNSLINDINLWHYLEIGIIVLVILYQLYHTIRVFLNISELKIIFKDKLFLISGITEKAKIGSEDFNADEFLNSIRNNSNGDLNVYNSEEVIRISLVDTFGHNKIIKRIKVAINTYLINNFGASVNFYIIKDIVDREVDVKDEEINQSISLPLFLGLAATMVGIIFGLFSMPELNDEGFSTGINALITGVKIAMIGSLSGLACTTFLSSFSYKRAKQIVQKDKNEQLTYLQAKLLPELIKAEDTGVSGLKASLDRFARVARNISDNVLIAANQTGDNLERQNEVLEKVESMKVFKITKWNLELFDKLEKNMEVLKRFAMYLTKMDQISSQLSDFAAKTTNVNKVVDEIERTLNESKELTRFLSSHFEKIENIGDITLKSVGIAESHFEGAIKSLSERTEGMIGQLYKSAGNHESKLEDIYKEIENNLNQITAKYLEVFKNAYADSVPKFEQLDNLSLMKNINASINSMVQREDLTRKLSSIEALLQKRNTSTNSESSNKKATSKTAKETTSLGKVIKKIF